MCMCARSRTATSSKQALPRLLDGQCPIGQDRPATNPHLACAVHAHRRIGALPCTAYPSVCSLSCRHKRATTPATSRESGAGSARFVGITGNVDARHRTPAESRPPHLAPSQSRPLMDISAFPPKQTRHNFFAYPAKIAIRAHAAVDKIEGAVALSDSPFKTADRRCSFDRMSSVLPRTPRKSAVFLRQNGGVQPPRELRGAVALSVQQPR